MPLHQYLKHISLGLQTLCMCILTDYRKHHKWDRNLLWDVLWRQNQWETASSLHQVTTDWKHCTEIQKSHIQVTVNFTEWHHITYLQDFKISLVIVKPRGTFPIIFRSSLAKSPQEFSVRNTSFHFIAVPSMVKTNCSLDKGLGGDAPFSSDTNRVPVLYEVYLD